MTGAFSVCGRLALKIRTRTLSKRACQPPQRAGKEWLGLREMLRNTMLNIIKVLDSVRSFGASPLWMTVKKAQLGMTD